MFDADLWYWKILYHVCSVFIWAFWTYFTSEYSHTVAVYCARSAAAYEVWLWTWQGLYIVTYPKAVLASLTNTLGILWHSQGVTLYSAYKPHSGGDSHSRRRGTGWRKIHDSVEWQRRSTFSNLLAGEGTKCPDGAPSIPSPPSVSFCFDTSLSTHWITKSWLQFDLDLIWFEKKNNPWNIPMIGTGKQQGEVPSPHQRMLQILSEGSQRP